MGNNRGRRRSIPETMTEECFRLKDQGYGYRTIASRLHVLGVATTKSAVERLIRGLPPYDEKTWWAAQRAAPEAASGGCRREATGSSELGDREKAVSLNEKEPEHGLGR